MMKPNCPGCGIPLWQTDMCMKCIQTLDHLTYFLVWASGVLSEKQVHQRIRRLRRMNVIAAEASREEDPVAYLETNSEFRELMRQEMALSED